MEVTRIVTIHFVFSSSKIVSRILKIKNAHRAPMITLGNLAAIRMDVGVWKNRDDSFMQNTLHNPGSHVKKNAYENPQMGLRISSSHPEGRVL